MNTQEYFVGVNPLDPDEQTSVTSRLWERVYRLRAFLLIVVLPTLLVAGYYYLIAADQYESEAHFMVSQGSGQSAVSSGFGQLLGLTGASPSQSQAMSVPDYLSSHDAVEALNGRLNLVTMFRRPEADALSRFRDATARPEDLLKFYRSHVDVYFNRDTGITTLKVHAFRPKDAYAIVENLLNLSEQRVNAMNQRSYTDAVAMAEKQMASAENVIANTQARMTRFRQSQRDIDPQTSGEAQIRLVSDLNSRLAAARSQMQAMGSLINRSSPQYIALVHQVHSLETEIAHQSGALTGSGDNIAGSLGGYEDLRVRQEFAAKQYEAAAASLEKAREDAQRQQLYLVRVVDANLPVMSLYPERGKIIATVFLALFVAYGIGWLIVAGVREHAA